MLKTKKIPLGMADTNNGFWTRWKWEKPYHYNKKFRRNDRY